MAEKIIQTETTQSTNSVSKATTSQSLQYLVYFFFGIIETLLLFRFFLKLTGADVASGFVRFIYNSTALLVLPFEGIFRKAVAPGIETAAVFEPSTLLAILVFAILSIGIAKLISISAGEKQKDMP